MASSSSMIARCTTGSVFFSLMVLAALSGCEAWAPPGTSGSPLSETFYQYSCPNVVAIVKDQVEQILAHNLNVAGGLQRLHFHDCWVGGCDASVLLNSTSSNTAERDGNVNFKLRGMEEIDQIKEALEFACPGVVSCADILALAARDSIVKVGGPSWPVVLGRRDSVVSSADAADSNLPFPNLDFQGLVSNFAAKGFNTREMIILSGSHSIGRAHCNGVQPHLYNFTGVEDLTDPTLDAKFVKKLKKRCPKGNRANVVNMESTKNKFDSVYFQNILANRGLFSTDAAFITDDFGRQVVTEVSQPFSSFNDEFAAGMVKMGNMDPLTGSNGEIRKHCQFIN